ncbi:hypothetical protein SDC9_97752 [bioreactor metagenome]|uniref:Uncharacterized protein n=1 Tax=bioreactor metagenome TaxID=1076179 RepID=A0A645ADG5_9ZZZZ
MIGTQRCRAHIGRIGIDIIGKDDVVRSHLDPVRKPDALFELDRVVGEIGCLVIIDPDRAWPSIGIVRSVVGNRFAIDSIINDAAQTVGGQHVELCQLHHIRIRRTDGIIGRKILRKLSLGNHKRANAGDLARRKRKKAEYDCQESQNSTGTVLIHCISP